MNPPAVVGLGNALKSTGGLFDGIVTDITSAEFLSGLTSGVAGNVGNLGDMSTSAGNQLIDKANEAAGFKLPGITGGPGMPTGNLSSPSNSGPTVAVSPGHPTMGLGGPGGTVIAPATPVDSIGTPTKGGAAPPIGSGHNTTTMNPGGQAATGITGPPPAPTAINQTVAIPPIKGPTISPTVSKDPWAGYTDPLGEFAGLAPPPPNTTTVSIPPVKGPAVTPTTNLNPGAQAAMGISPTQATPPASGTAVSIPPIKGATIPPPVTSSHNANDPWGGVDPFGGIDEMIVAENQERIESLVAQGFTQNDAITFVVVNGSPADETYGSPAHVQSLTTGELHALVSTWSGTDNDPILDALINELDDRAEMANGAAYSQTNVDALIVSEVMGVDYADAAAAVDFNDQQALKQDITESVIALDGMHPTQQDYVLQDINAAIGELVPPHLVPHVAAALHNGASIDDAIVLANAAYTSDDGLKPSEVHLMQTDINTAMADGVSQIDALNATLIANATELSAAEILAVVQDEGVDAETAAMTVLQADFIGLTVAEHNALQGLQNESNFNAIDNATGGNTDGVVSINDLEFVVNAPAGTFNTEVVAAAQAALDSPALLAMLDDASANNDILDGDSFGSTEFDDHKISLADIAAFSTKAQINGILGSHGDAIDTAADDSGVADGYFSKSDYEAYLDQADELGLSDSEVAALQLVIEQEMFDQTFFEEHRDEIALAAAVVGAVVVVAATGGAASGLVLVGVGALAGGTAAAGTTLLINGTSDNLDLTDGLAGNTFNGVMIGASVGGIGGIITNAPTILAGSTGGQVLAGLTLTSEVAGIVGTGGADLALGAVGVSDNTIDDLKGTADIISLATGAPDLAIGVATGGASVINKLTGSADNAASAANAAEALDDAVGALDSGVPTLPDIDDVLTVVPTPSIPPASINPGDIPASAATPGSVLPSSGSGSPASVGTAGSGGGPGSPAGSGGAGGSGSPSGSGGAGGSGTGGSGGGAKPPNDPIGDTVELAHAQPGATVGNTHVNPDTGVTMTKFQNPDGTNAVAVATPDGAVIVTHGNPLTLPDGTTIQVSTQGTTMVKPPGSGQTVSHGDVVAQSLDSAPPPGAGLTPNQKGNAAHKDALSKLKQQHDPSDIVEELHVQVQMPDGTSVEIHPDFLVKNDDGTYTYYESKYSSNAPYTPNQQTTIPAINDSAAGLPAIVVANVPEHGPDLGDTIVISDVVTMVMHP